GARGRARRIRAHRARRARAARVRVERALRLSRRVPRPLLREAALPLRAAGASRSVHVPRDGARGRRARPRPRAALRAPGRGTRVSRRALVEGLIERYPRVPPEAVLKEDLLRTGIAFDESALSDNLDGAVKPKSYFIFSFDQSPLADL